MARSKTPPPAAESGADILLRLESEHRAIDALFEHLERAEGASARPLAFARLRDALTAHAVSEETLFYRALRTSPSADGHRGASRAHEEHHGIKDWLAQLGATSPDAPEYEVRAGRLKEEVKSHVLEEERVLFPLARKVLGAPRLQTLGQRMDAARPRPKNVDRG